MKFENTEARVYNILKFDNKLPLVILHDTVGFPGASIDFEVIGLEGAKSIECSKDFDDCIILALEGAYKEDENNDEHTDNPLSIYSVGVVAQIEQHLETSDKLNRISVQCFQRVKLNDVLRLNDDPSGCILAEVEDFSMTPDFENDENPEKAVKDFSDAVEAGCMNIKKAFSEYAEMNDFSKDTIRVVNEEDDVYRLISRVLYTGIFNIEDMQHVLESKDILDSCTSMFAFLMKYINIGEFRRQLFDKAKQLVDIHDRDEIINQEIHILQSQLSSNALDMTDTPDSNNSAKYLKKIEKLPIDETDKEHLRREASMLSKLPPYSQESYVASNYLDTVLDVPWKTMLETKKSEIYTIDYAAEVLEKGHYGLKKVKKRVLEALSVQEMTKKPSSNIICLVGPPGTGKTSIVKSIAEATGRKYERISLGGVRDEADIRGHRRTYVASMPGRIVNAITKAKTFNCLLLLDEIDKLGHDGRGDPSSAMLEVLDSEQNQSFRDHFLEVPINLKNVMFIATANDLSNVPAPLLDRMEIIELSSYTREEKFHIAKDHLVAKQIKANGLNKTKFKIDDDVIYEIIDNYTREAGVRELERTIASLCRKADMIIAKGEAKSLHVTMKKIESLLGARKYLPDDDLKEDAVGKVNGLAWTSVGGVLMPLEAVVLEGKGRVKLTGSLGDVMKESAELAISYARQKADVYGIKSDFIENKDIHIHAPEGAVPKDGPSAGVTMTTAVISALSGKKVRGDVAMTGEITLHGDVLPIGGLREKTMAAYKAGIQTVIIPFKNKPNMEEVDETVKSNVNFVYAKNLDDVLSVALRK